METATEFLLVKIFTSCVITQAVCWAGLALDLKEV